MSRRQLVAAGGAGPVVGRASSCGVTSIAHLLPTRHARHTQSVSNVRRDHPELLDGWCRWAGGREVQNGESELPASCLRWRLCPLHVSTLPAHAATSQVPHSPTHPPNPPSSLPQLRAGNVLGDVLEREEGFDAIHVGAGGGPVGRQVGRAWLVKDQQRRNEWVHIHQTVYKAGRPAVSAPVLLPSLAPLPGPPPQPPPPCPTSWCVS